MVKLVQSFPTLLRSDLMDVFLHITERIHSIKMLLKVAPSLNMTSNATVSSSAVSHETAGATQQPQSAADAYEAAAESAGVLNSAPHSHFTSSSDPLGASAVNGHTATANRRGSGTAARGGGGPVVMVDEEEAQKKAFSSKILVR